MRADKYIKNFIDGTLMEPQLGNHKENYNPATGEVYSYTPESTDVDIQKAVEAAERAGSHWYQLGENKRFRILSRIADIIEQHQDEFAQVETADTGRSFQRARNIDVEQSHLNLRYYATAILHQSSNSHFLESKTISYTMRYPVGVVGCISAWNEPLNVFTKKIAPALAVGNTVVATPSQVTPMSAYLFSKACMKGGLPPGVLNIVYGSAANTLNTIASHPKIKAVSFTGSQSKARRIAEAALPSLKKTALQIGGKNPNIIFKDCDFEKMIATTLWSSFDNQGQSYLACPRIFVERPIYQKFKEEFIKRTQYLKVGDPFSATTDVGAIVSEKHLFGIIELVNEAKKQGGDILLGGEQIVFDKKSKHYRGYFFQPTIIEGLAHHFRLNEEEVYGPVVTIMPFDTEEEVIQFANESDYGFAASIWTSDVQRMTRVASSLHVETAWINDWGYMNIRNSKNAGQFATAGWEGSKEALEFFTKQRNILINYQ